MRPPSGAHANAVTPSVPLVSASASPPASDKRYSWRMSVRSETNASHVPSGENAGCVLDFFAFVTCRPLPATRVSASHSSVS